MQQSISPAVQRTVMLCFSYACTTHKPLW